MRFNKLALLLFCGLAISPVQKAIPADDAKTDFLGGKDLEGWQGVMKHWSVKDGALVGTTFPDGNSFNTFLCSKKSYKDFELKFQVKLQGKGWPGNSGVQIRSKIIDTEDGKKHFAVSGPQCDMGSEYWGSLYGEAFGDKMMKQAPADVVKKAVKPNDFNDYAIKVIGKHVTIKINGETTVDDDFDKMPDEGIIAWQLHGGMPMEVTFKDIKFKELTK
jgi:hypothetical protein